jgi:hypothetical protein
MCFIHHFANTLEVNMAIHEEYAQDLIDTDPLEVLDHMDLDQIAGTFG